MKVAHLPEPTEERVVFRDGLGVREVRDSGTGEAVEWLHLDPAFAAVDTPLRDRVTRLAKLQHVKFARILSLEPAPKGRGPILISSHVPGTRLAEALEMAGHGLISFEPGAGLQILREVLGALAVLHDSRNVSHGSLGPERVVITAKGRVVMVEHVLAQALDRLQRPRHQLWREWRVPTPPAAGLVRFDMHTDLAQAGILALAVLLGRPLDEDEYPHRLRGLLPLVQERIGKSPAAAVAGDVVAFLERLAPVDSRRAFKTVREAQQAYEGLVSANAAAMGVTPSRVKAVFAAVTAMSVAATPAPSATAAAEASAHADTLAPISVVAPLAVGSPLAIVETITSEVAAVGSAAAAPDPDIDIEALLALEAELEGNTSPAAFAASVDVVVSPPLEWPDLDGLAHERAELERQFADLVATVAPGPDAPVHLIPDTPVTSEPLVDARVVWSSMPAGDQFDAVDTGDAVAAPAAPEHFVTAWLAEPPPAPAGESDGEVDVDSLAVVAHEASLLDAETEHLRADWWKEALPWRDDQQLDSHEEETSSAIDVASAAAAVEALPLERGVGEDFGLISLDADVTFRAELASTVDVEPEAETQAQDEQAVSAVAQATASLPDELPLWGEDPAPEGPAAMEPSWVGMPTDAPADLAGADAPFDVQAADAPVPQPVDDAPVVAAASLPWCDVESADVPDERTPFGVDAVEESASVTDAWVADAPAVPPDMSMFDGAFVDTFDPVVDDDIVAEEPLEPAAEALDAAETSSAPPVDLVVAEEDEVVDAVAAPEQAEATAAPLLHVAGEEPPAEEPVDGPVHEFVGESIEEAAGGPPEAQPSVTEPPTAEPPTAEPSVTEPPVEALPSEILTPALPASIPDLVPEVVIVDDGNDQNAWDRLPSELPAVADELSSPPVAVAAATPATSTAAKKKRRRDRRKKGAPRSVMPAAAVPPQVATRAPSVVAPLMALSLTPTQPDAGKAEADVEDSRGVPQMSLLHREVPAWTPLADAGRARLPDVQPAVAAVTPSLSTSEVAPGVVIDADRTASGGFPLAASVCGESVLATPPARPAAVASQSVPASSTPLQIAGPQGSLTVIGVEATRPFEQEIRAVGMPDADDRQSRVGRASISSMAEAIGPAATPHARILTSESWGDPSVSPVAGRGSNWRRLIAASVLVALFQGVAFAAWWWVQPGARGTLVVQTGKTGVEVLLDDKVVGRTPFREDIAPGRHKLKLREGGNVREMPVEISVGVVTTQAIDWPASGAGRGNLQVTSNPAGAEIFVGGRSRGKAPQLLENLPAGDQVLMLRGDAGSVTVRAAVLAGETSPLEVKIFAGWIQVDAAAELNLLLNGREKIGSTMDGQILLPPGVHRVLVQNDSLNVRQWLTLTVEPGAVKRVPFIIAPGTLTLQEDAEVFVDGASAGTTPGTITIAPGTHDIVIRHADGTERRQALTVRAGQRVEF